ncbi:hypothetical protein [Deinococcus rufus]|uniref:Oligosaccharide repeat unit polymerase n=1 Tax=Deinococcus rufus TaxID=2136097 RepID=A0ABV7ZDM5_9DEIO
MLIAFSILITILYYISVGYNVLFLGISAIFSGETYDIATLRLESYSSSRYLFPGYVNQFKNSILPISSVILIYYLYSVRHKYRGAIAGTLGLMSLIGLLGTGQRGAFVVFVLVVLCFTYYISRITFFRALRTALLVGIPIFFLSSIVLDRNNTQDTLATDPIQTVTVLGRELGNRIFSDNQITSIVGYRYVSFLPTAHGEEWGQAILGLLPGESFRGSDLSGQIFKILYGNDRGTAPIGLWGSVFYNFGTIGLVVFPLLFGAFLRGIFSYFSRNTTLNTGQIAGIAGVFVTLGTWVSDGPVTVLNTGALAYLFIYFICTPKTRPKYNE